MAGWSREVAAGTDTATAVPSLPGLLGPQKATCATFFSALCSAYVIVSTSQISQIRFYNLNELALQSLKFIKRFKKKRFFEIIKI